MEDIKAVLLVNGDEIIGKVQKTEFDSIVITKPTRFIPTQDKMMMVSLFMFGKFEECEIKTSHIIAIVPARKEIAEAWDEKHGTGLVRPKSEIVVS